MVIKLQEYGSILTGREFGASVFEELRNKIKTPVILDFDGVDSLGSSFGDEVVPPIAKLQNGRIQLMNVNKVIRRVLEDVSEDGGIEIEYIDTTE